MHARLEHRAARQGRCNLDWHCYEQLGVMTRPAMAHETIRSATDANAHAVTALAGGQLESQA